MRAIGLEARFFCGVSRARELRGASLSRSSRGSAESYNSWASSSARNPSSSSEVQSVVGDGLAVASLTSAHLCRWIIDYNEMQVGMQIGVVSYGIVHRGRKGFDGEAVNTNHHYSWSTRRAKKKRPFLYSVSGHLQVLGDRR